MKTKLKISFLLMALSSVAHSKDEIIDQNLNKAAYHVPSQGVNHVYFTYSSIGGVDYRRLSVVTSDVFQPCPALIDGPPPQTNWSEVREADLGEKRFDMLSSVLLSAVLADKTVSLIIADDECYGTRAKITSVRINK